MKIPHRRIQVLLVEDNVGDARLIREFLADAGVNLFALETADRLSAAKERLAAGGIDLVLLDLSLPDSHGLDTLLRLQTQDPHTPIVVLTGFDDGVLAVQALRSGAQDYLIKGEQVDSNLLTRTIRYAIERKRLEQQLLDNEQRFRNLIEHSADVISLIDAHGLIVYESPAVTRVLGYAVAELTGRNAFDLLHPDDQARLLELFADIMQRPNATLTTQVRFRHKNQSWRWLEATGTNLLAEPGIGAIVVNYHDITEHKRAEAEIVQLYKEMEQRVAERTGQLAEANERLTELDRLKDQFVGRINHELRTPLTNILIYLELLTKGKPEKFDRYLQTLLRETYRLRLLIEDLLNISQLERDAVPVELAAIDLNQLLADLVEDRSESVGLQGLTLTYVPHPDLPLVHTDARLVTQVASNLIANGLNYTPPTGQIVVTTDQDYRDERAWLTFAVSDTGPGLSPDDRLHLFERFYRGTAASDYKVPGTGLGLAFCKEVVLKLGGHIEVDSAASGSTFRVYLPLDGTGQPA
jgi:PAS domain S-box-containing protein